MTEPAARLLIVDDERSTREALVRFLRRRYELHTADDGAAAIEYLKHHDCDLVLTDLRMPGADGMSVLEAARSKADPPLCILFSAYGSIENAVQAVKEGAFDFVTKPVKLEQLEAVIEKALATRRANHPETRDPESGIVAASPQMREILELIRTVAPGRATVLLTGESGTGKEVAARALHDWSGRTGLFVPVHCAALPANLLESELFGHEKGAFTGATERRKGRFELAENGTLFLDEIGEIDPTTQVKLLRVLETRTFERVGGVESLTSNARLVAATNRDLAAMVREGTFREDLFYRLNVVNLELPPLRERPEDTAILIDRFLREAAEENNRPLPELSVEARRKLLAYAWPGNIRELKNCMERMVVLSRTPHLGVEELPPEIRRDPATTPKPATPAPLPAAAPRRALPAPVEPVRRIVDLERAEIEQALRECGNNKTRAAEILGISRRTLHRRLREYALEKADQDV